MVKPTSLIARRLPDTARVFGVLLGLAGWYAMASVFPNELMPYPLETLELTWELVWTGVAVPHLVATLKRTIWGFLGAMVLGTAIGVMMGTNAYLRQFTFPYVSFGLALPAVVWAAITTLVFGFSELAPITATILVTFPFVALNVWKGAENIDAELIEMGQSFEVSNLRLLVRVIVPNAAPQLFSSVRFGLAISWKIVTIAETFAASNGIGYKLVQAYDGYQFEQAWAWALVFMIVILIIEYGIMRPLESKTFEYRPEADLRAYV